MSDEPLARAYEFGPFRFDVPNRLLLRAGAVVALKPKEIETLLLLLINHGRVMDKEELMRVLWPDASVEEANLTQNIYALRNALSQRQERTGYIETIPRRGYRFVAEVTTHADGAEPRSLAVLPFTSLPAAVRDEWLEVGIADALVTTLGNSGLLIVRPITASRRYEDVDHDPLAAARAMKVDAVLDGSIQRSGLTIRVTARLIRAGDGATLWAGRFDEAITAIFDLQDTIAERITTALEVRLRGAQKARLTKRYTGDSEAYQSYLNGRYNLAKSTEDGVRKAIGFFEQAIAADPKYALAYVGIADAYTALDWYGILSTRDSNPHAFAAAQQALALDPELAEAHAALAVALQYRWDWTGAEEAFRRAIAVNPTYAAARQWFGLHLSFRSRFAEALAQMARAQELDPTSLTIRAQRALILYFARRYPDAISECLNVLDVEPAHDEARIYLALSLVETSASAKAVAELRRTGLAGTPDVKAMLARALATAGRPDDAREIVADLVAGYPAGYIPRFWIAAALVALGQFEDALAQLEAASQDPDDSYAGINVAPLFDAIRRQPRFQALVTGVGLWPGDPGQ